MMIHRPQATYSRASTKPVSMGEAVDVWEGDAGYGGGGNQSDGVVAVIRVECDKVNLCGESSAAPAEAGRGERAAWIPVLL